MYAELFSSEKSVLEKVAIVEHSWNNTTEFWPNKHQELLNWLTHILAQKKSSCEEERQNVWKCFHDILQTRKCHEQPTESWPLSMKPVMYQLLLTELSKVDAGTDQCDIITTCCHKVLTSPVFGHVWSSRLENLLQIMQFAVQLCLKQLSSCLLQLLNTAGCLYTSLCRRSANVQQVISQVSQKLFLPLSLLRHTLTSYSGKLKEQLSEALQTLDSTILAACFPKDLATPYEVYLKLMTSEEKTDTKPPKYIGSFFTQISTALQSTNSTEQEAMLQMLTFLYGGFVNQYLGNHRLICFQFGQYLCELLHVLPSKPSGTLDTKTPLGTKEQLVAMETVLRIMVEKDVYNMATDHVHGDKQLSWLRRCSQWVNSVEVKQRSSSWFQIQCHLLELNYSTIEPNLKTFLEVSWLSTKKVPVEAHKDQAQLLCDLVELYTQLRQLPKFVTKLTEILLEVKVKEEIYFPKELHNCFAENFQSQPISVILTLWEKLLENIQSQYLQDASNVEGLCVHCHLLAILLTNMHVDQAVSQQMAPRVTSMLRHMAQNVLRPLVKNINKKEYRQHTAVVLQLLHSWGQLQLIMSQFCKQLSGSKADSSKHIVHHYLSKPEWERMMETVRNVDSPSAEQFGILLEYQALRMVLCGANSDITTDSIQRAVDDTLKILEKGLNTTVTWDLQPLSVTKETLPLSIWSATCDLLPLIADSLSDHQVERLASHVISTLSQQQDIVAKPGGYMFAKDITQKFLNQGTLWEISTLVTSVLDQIWIEIAKEIADISSATPRKKKRKSSQTIEIPDLIKQILGSQSEAVTMAVTSLLDSDPSSTMDSDTADTISRHLHVVDRLPLPHIPVECQTHHLLCSLVFLASVKPRKSTHKLVLTGLKQLQLLYSCQHGKQLCEQLSPVSVLEWLSTFVEKQSNEDVKSSVLEVHQVVFKLTCWSIQHLKPLHKLVKQTISNLDEEDPNETSLKLLVMMIQHIVKVSHRRYLREGVLDGIQPIQDTLSDWLENIIAVWWDSKSECKQNPSIQALVLSAYSALKTDSEKNSETKTVLMCNLCLELLQSKDQVGAVLENCLTFIRTLFDQPRINDDSVMDTTTQSLNNTQLTESKLTKSVKRKPPSDTSDESEAESDSENDSESDENLEDESKMDTDVEQHVCSENDDHLTLFVAKCWICLLNLLDSCFSQSDSTDESGDLTPHLLSANQKQEIESTLGHLVNSASSEVFVTWLRELGENITLPNGEHHPQRVITTLQLWTNLLESVSQRTHYRELISASQRLLLHIHPLVSQISPTSDGYIPLVKGILNMETHLLTSHQVLPEYSCQVMWTCHAVPLETFSTEDFIACYTAIMELLSVLLKYHASCVLKRLHVMTPLIKRLLDKLMWFGRQTQAGYDKSEVERLALCAHLMDRLLQQLCSHKQECSKVVVYTVADFTASLSKVTLLPAVKKNLLPAIYHCLDICDEHSIALLHATLSPGRLEIFKSIHGEYVKYHKYTGRV